MPRKEALVRNLRRSLSSLVWGHRLSSKGSLRSLEGTQNEAVYPHKSHCCSKQLRCRETMNATRLKPVAGFVFSLGFFFVLVLVFWGFFSLQSRFLSHLDKCLICTEEPRP